MNQVRHWDRGGFDEEIDSRNRVCVGCEDISWSVHPLRWVRQRINDTADGGNAADSDEDGFKAVSRIIQSASQGLPRWRQSSRFRQLYLLIRIFHVISLEICLGKSLPQRLMVS